MLTKKQYRIVDYLVSEFKDALISADISFEKTTRKRQAEFIFFNVVGSHNQLIAFEMLWDRIKYSLEPKQ